MDKSPKHIAIIADWLIDFGWAELVISHLLEIFPEADIYTSACFMDHPMLKWRRVYTSWLQKIPFLNRRHKLAGILRPFAFRSFDLSGYDIVICSSSAESKQVAMGKWNRWHSRNGESEGWKLFESDDKQYNNKQSERVFSPLGTFGTFGHESTARKPKVIVYCHTPIRYYWSHYTEYRNMMEFGWLNPLARFILDNLIGWLCKIDYEAAQKVDYFIANSKNTQERIKKYYHRESEVIYPWVSIPLTRGTQGVCSDNSETNPPTPLLRGASETENKRIYSDTTKTRSLLRKTTEQEYYISISRCIPYKKFDLLVDTFNENGKSLILITNTDNQLYRNLKGKSKPNITWKLSITQEEKNILLAWAKGFLFPPLEDFWLVPIEAMALGIPVIAFGEWWATETVIDWTTWVFFDKQTVSSLSEWIERFETMGFDKEIIKIHAEKFDKTIFQRKIIDFIESKVQ